ncbi:glycosyltransferase [Paenibacillus alginolyticus]|uniref:Glycosyltransferase n=1 Tax=Paenibacillus alginolyticus TaxID=59839 RepID=A0ABT4GDW1_9BACL|nr:glycosyltransferase [Paenibacillus alginolyticus]MCY9694376.1 glycosyltransferase [Paenibacillus alginolyticus]MEC0147545.1 glycosyltransferase [Paenibacillus alginolyticus]
MYPKVSIIIPFYNDPYIEQSIVSALGQTYPNIEIIVVDDGSTMHQEKINPFLTRVHYLGKANGGTASALNYGIRMASGQYVAWLSSDDMFYPDKIERQLIFMLNHQSLISYTAFDEVDAYNNVIGRHKGTNFANQAELVRAFISYDPINGCTVMVNKDLVSSLGFFNEALPYTQDYDMWIRALLRRTPIHYYDVPLTLYRWHGEMGTKKHWPAILDEIGHIQAHYRDRLLEYVHQLGG